MEMRKSSKREIETEGNGEREISREELKWRGRRARVRELEVGREKRAKEGGKKGGRGKRVCAYEYE